MIYKKIIILIFFILIWGCGPDRVNDEGSDYTKYSSEPSQKELEDSSFQAMNESDWLENQDSIRDMLLNRLEKNVLKNSILEELYVRNIAKLVNDSIEILLTFDLHGPDCGAPDCYSTNVKFSIEAGDDLSIPDKIDFYEYEEGCINQNSLNGIFTTEIINESLIIFKCENKNRLLLLTNDKISFNDHALYFTSLDMNEINYQSIEKLLRSIEFEENLEIYPYRSFQLNISDYTLFLR